MCEYCERKEGKDFPNAGSFNIWLDSNKELFVDVPYCGINKVPINFCPICGRKLKDDL